MSGIGREPLLALIWDKLINFFGTKAVNIFNGIPTDCSNTVTAD